MYITLYVHTVVCVCVIVSFDAHSIFVYTCSSCNRYCDPRELELMDEVEYCIVRKNKKLAADEIKKLPRGTILTDVSIM